MTIKAATEDALGQLHNKVAKVMVQALDVYDASQIVYLELTEAAHDNPELLETIPDKPPEVSATLLGTITKFLNDNKITCVPEESAGLSDLAQRLQNKRKRVGNVVHMSVDE